MPTELFGPVIVREGWDYFRGQASDLLTRTMTAIHGMSTPLWNMTAPTITFVAPTFEEGTFTRPVAPADPVVPTVDDTVPAAPTLGAIALDALPPMPAEPDFSGMVYRQPAAPNAPLPVRPADTDVPLLEIDIPDAPAFVMPADPVLYALNLPAIPDLVMPEFQGVRPAFDLHAPTEGLNWTFQAYDRSTIDTIKGQLSSMTINGLALPPAIEQAIFDRARGREDILSEQQVSEATRALSARGLRQPAGLLSRTLDRIRTAARITSSGASRDLGIEIAKQNIESIKFGLSQAIALESTLLQQHVAIQGLILDAAKAAHAAMLEVFNGQVALHNAQWEGFKAEAQVFEARIRALAAQADVLKTRIEAEKVKGDINEGLVRAYAEKVRSLSALSDMYRAQVEAAKAKGEINVQRLEQVRLRLQTYGIDVDAWGKQWDAYKAQVDAETNGLRYYETMGSVFGQRVTAWRGQVEAQSTRAQSQIAAQNQQLELFRATLDGIKTRVLAQSTNVDAITKTFAAKTSLYGVEGQLSAAESAAGDRTAQLRMDQAKLTFDAAARNAEVAGNFALKKADLAIEGSRGAAQVLGQLTASVMSGVNMSASSGYSESMGWSWSGEI